MLLNWNYRELECKYQSQHLFKKAAANASVLAKHDRGSAVPPSIARLWWSVSFPAAQYFLSAKTGQWVTWGSQRRLPGTSLGAQPPAARCPLSALAPVCCETLWDHNARWDWWIHAIVVLTLPHTVCPACCKTHSWTHFPLQEKYIYQLKPAGGTCVPGITEKPSSWHLRKRRWNHKTLFQRWTHFIP